MRYKIINLFELEEVPEESISGGIKLWSKQLNTEISTEPARADIIAGKSEYRFPNGFNINKPYKLEIKNGDNWEVLEEIKTN